MDQSFSDTTIEIIKQITKVNDKTYLQSNMIYILPLKMNDISKVDTSTSTSTGLLIKIPTNNWLNGYNKIP